MARRLFLASLPEGFREPEGVLYGWAAGGRLVHRVRFFKPASVYRNPGRGDYAIWWGCSNATAHAVMREEPPEGMAECAKCFPPEIEAATLVEPGP